ncbi:MAG TPA: hypothetical protein VNK91_15455 [Burkholderiaceae bacterium]|jgi:hypothetical protein|nr:hypothetical protein [Burkholderiaceae bacterium]
MTRDLTRAAVFAGVATACLFGLAACGGNDDGDGLTEAQREDRLASTWPGMLTFALAQIARPDADSAEPRSIASIVPPLSEDAEPAAL